MVSRPDTATRGQRFHLRATAQQGALIKAAAKVADKNVTDFVLEAATTAAEHTLADRRWFVVDDTTYDAFLVSLDRPARDVPGLAELFSRPLPKGVAD